MSSPRIQGDSIARNTAFALATQAATGVFTAAITIFLVRALDPAGYGLFALALAFAGVIAFPSDFGVSLSAARYVAERRGDAAGIAAVLVRALNIKLVLTSAVSVALLALAGPLAELYDQPELAAPLRAVSIALLGQNLVFLFANVFVAMGRIAWQFALIAIEAASEATATIGLVLLLGGATAAAAGRAIGYAVGALVGLVFVVRLLGRRAIAERRGGPRTRELAGYAGALMVVDAAYAVFNQIDILLVGALLGSAAAGIYGAPLKLMIVLNYPGLALAQAIAPRLARHPGVAPDVGALAAGLRLLITIQAGVAAAVAVWAEPVVDLVLGAGYEESVDVLRALAAFLFLVGIGPLLSTTLNYMGEARRRVPIAIGCAVLNFGLTIAFIETMGVTGAAWSLAISYGVYVLAHARICHQQLGLPARRLAWTMCRSLLAAAALAGVLAAVGPSGAGPAEWALAAIGGASAFLAVLVVSGETSLAELRALPRTLRGTEGR